MSTPDVLIVGGGIVGASCAHAFAHRKLTVHLVDAGNLDGVATTAAAGMLAPMAESHADDPLLGFCVRARDYYGEIVPELEAETGVDVGLWRGGVYKVAFTAEGVEREKQQVAWQRQRGFSTEWLPTEELLEHIPGIGPDALGATLAPEDGALEPLALVTALRKSAGAAGAKITSNARVDGLRIEGARAVGVSVGGASLDAGAVVIAAGCWSRLIEHLPRPISVEPIRGQMVALEWPREEPAAILYGPGGYVLRRGDEALAGSTMEHAGFDAAVTEQGMESIVGTATRLLPALTQSKRLRAWAGLRPSTPDGRPLLGRDPEIENLWYATGHGRNGILLAGLSADTLAQLYAGDEIEYDLAPVNPARFWTN